MSGNFWMWSLWGTEDSPARDCSSTINAKYSKDFQKHSGRKIDFSRCSIFAWVTCRRHVLQFMTFGLKLGGGCSSRHGEPLMIAQLQNCTVIKSYWTKKNPGKYSLNYFGPWAFRWETIHWYYSFSNIHFIEYQDRVKCWLTMVNRGEKSLLWALISFPLLPPWFCALECRLCLKGGWRMGGRLIPSMKTKDSSYFHSAVCNPLPNSLTITLNCELQQCP